MRRTRAEAEQTRQQLLDAALRVFSRQGYAATTLDDIAREAAVTRGAIYWHFQGKAELYQALLAERQGPAQATFSAILAAPEPPVARLRALIRRAVALLEEDPTYRATMELALFKTGEVPELADGLAAKVAGIRGFRHALVDLVREGQRQGSIRDGVDPEAAATAVLGLLNGVALTWLLDPAAFSPAAQADTLAETLVRGLAARDDRRR